MFQLMNEASMLRNCYLIVGVFLMGFGFTSDVAGQSKEKKAEVQLHCPVFTDRIVGPGNRSIRYRGIEVFFSSDLAARKWMRDPESYLDTAILPQLGDLILPEREMLQVYCPVHPKWKVSVKDPSVIYQGKRVFLFDKEAVKIWDSAPEKFFKPELLPQFPKEPPPSETEDAAEPPS
jgi:hypothetical protein